MLFLSYKINENFNADSISCLIRLHPEDKSDRYNLIKNISRKHDITLFSLIKTDEEKKYIPELEKFCKRVEVFKRPEKPWTLRNIIKTGFGLFPFLVVRNWSRFEKEAVTRENWRVIIINYSCGNLLRYAPYSRNKHPDSSC